MFQCVCAVDGYEEPAVYNSRIVTARKEYHCYECRSVISKGTKHEYVRALYEGHWSTYRTCMVCVAIRKDFRAPGCGFIHGALWESLREAYEGVWDDEDGVDDSWLRP